MLAQPAEKQKAGGHGREPGVSAMSNKFRYRVPGPSQLSVLTQFDERPGARARGPCLF